MIIYPNQPIVRDTARSFEIDDNDPDFIRDPHGLFAMYLNHTPPLLLCSTELKGHWDVVTSIQGVHLEKLRRLLDAAITQYPKEPFYGHT